jgi:hypothetical protein
VCADYCVTSCDLGVFVDESAESITPQDPERARRSRIISPIWRLLGQAPMWAMSVVMIDVLGQDMLQVALPGDEDPVGAFSADAADPAFGDRVRPWRPYRRLDDPGADGGEHRIEGGGEFGVPIADQEPHLAGALAEVHEQVAGLLRRPNSGRVGGDAGQMHTLRVPCSMKNSTYSRRKNTVSTWKKSTAQIEWACAVRNWHQPWPARRGAGSMRASLRIFRTRHQSVHSLRDSAAASLSSHCPWALSALRARHDGRGARSQP